MKTDDKTTFDPIRVIFCMLESIVEIDSKLKLVVWALILAASSTFCFLIAPILVVHVYPFLLVVVEGALDLYNVKRRPKLELFLGLFYALLAGIPMIYFFLNAEWMSLGVFAMVFLFLIGLSAVLYRRAKFDQKKRVEK